MMMAGWSLNPRPKRLWFSRPQNTPDLFRFGGVFISMRSASGAPRHEKVENSPRDAESPPYSRTEFDLFSQPQTMNGTRSSWPSKPTSKSHAPRRKQPIKEIGEKLDIPYEALLPYGHDKAKVSQEFINSLEGRNNGKLILVTAINPTPAGEGKTTTTVGLGDGLCAIGKKAAICIREASLGPKLWHEGWRGWRRPWRRLSPWKK